MNRGKSQSLYKYLPDSWIDFSMRGKERKQYIARVVRWNSEQLTDINKKRLLRIVNQAVQAFASQAISPDPNQLSPTTGFGAELNVYTCDVLTPKSEGDERGIVAEISPLTFYCKKCHKVYQFRNADDYRKYTKCRDCHIELTQFRQIYFCKCGWASDKHPVYCNKHNAQNIYWDGKYSFYCKKCGPKNKIPMRKKCEICGTMCGPKVALDPAQYFPFNLSLIDLIDERVEEFITNSEYGASITIAYWLGKITKDELQYIIKNGIVIDNKIYENKYSEAFEMFRSVGLDEESAKAAATATANKECGSKYNDIVKKIKSSIFTTKVSLDKLAEMIIEYDMVLNSEDISTLDTAISIARILNTNAEPESFKDIAKKYGFKTAQVCGRIPFVSCSYGFTREKTDYEQGVQLRAFKEEKSGRKNVYATRLNTEGVLFEIDRRMIIEWLLKNEHITVDVAPDLESEADMKLWFINNIKPELIKTFSSIDEIESPITYHVYRLIHSISHLLIRSAAELCGLDKNSLSEYIFTGVPAILVYCQNSQGFNLGALFNVFEAYFDKWLNKAYQSSAKCIFDPICIERYKSCAGCLFLNEVSCEHFNKDLDRTLIAGYVDKATKKRYFGFWEEN